MIALATRLIAALCQFGALVVLANRVGAESFGVASIAILGARLISAVAGKGLAPLVLAGRGIAVSSTSVGQLIDSRKSASAIWGLGFGVAVAVVFDFWLPIGILAVIVISVTSVATTRLVLFVESIKQLERPVIAISTEFFPSTIAISVAALVAPMLVSDSASYEALAILAFYASGQVLSALLAARLQSGLVTPEAAGPGQEDASLPQAPILASTVLSLFLPVAALAGARGLFDGQAAGQVSAVLRLLSPSMIVLAGVAATEMPHLGRLLANGSTEALSQFIRAQRVVFALVAPYQIGLLVYPGAAQFIFGSEYADVATAVQILAVGQLINCATGLSVETTQVLEGGARADAATGFGAAVVFLPITWVLASTLGLGGAEAVCLWFSGVLSVRSLVAWVFARRGLVEAKNNVELRVVASV